MARTGNLRYELSVRSRQLGAEDGLLHELTNGPVPSVIFGLGEDGRHGNFHPVSYKNIKADPAWEKRLTKVHTGYRKVLTRSEWRWKELDCANSSDALLMNVFCYQRTLTVPRIANMLGVDLGLRPEFGFRPRIPLRDGKVDRTEIDMKLGTLLVEAKLTEGDFPSARAGLVERYRDFTDVFHTRDLIGPAGTVPSYQLVRGVLAAVSSGSSFCLLCDARRPDLMEKWHTVMRAVKSFSLRCRLHVLTWQELASALPRPLRMFLAKKYGID